MDRASASEAEGRRFEPGWNDRRHAASPNNPRVRHGLLDGRDGVRRHKPVGRMGPASQDAHPTIPAHARGPPSGAPYGLGYGSVAQQGRAGGCGFETRRNHCASTSPVPIRFTIFPTGMGAMAARRAPLSQPQTRQRAPSFNPTHVNVAHAGRLLIVFPAGVGAMAVEAETLTRRPRCPQRVRSAPTGGASSFPYRFGRMPSADMTASRM